MSTTDHTVGINDLPNEVLEYLLSLLSPYRDYKNVMLVCRRWYHLMKGVKEREFQSFREAVSDGGLWWTAHPTGPNPNITERYSHSACYLNKCLYIFGGCTSNNTAFNDLWKLDLGTGEWIRPLAMGTYPSPKAYASLVPHRGRLVLFGGWSHPTPLSLHQAARFFLQLHTYTPESNNWEEIVTISSPQGLAGHGATVISDNMVVFGGCTVNGVSCNDVWVLDLIDYEWTLKIPAGNKPQPRYGHAQVKIDNNHILVVGGCGGPNMQFTDTWMLTMDDTVWRWEEIKVIHPENSAPQIWCHPACKVGDKMVVLSKISKPSSSPSSPSSVPQFRDPPVSVIGEMYRSASVSRCESKMSTAQGHCVCCQEVALVDKMSLRAKRSHPETSESSSQESSSDTDDGGSQCLASVRVGRGCRGGGLGGRKSASVTGDMPPPSSDRMPSQQSVFGSKAPLRSVNSHCHQMEPQKPKNASTHASLEQASSSREGLKTPSPQPSGLPVSTCPPGGRNGLPLIRPNAMRNRQKQLEMLKRYEDRIKGQRAKDANPVYVSNCCHGSSGPCKPLFAAQKLVTHPMYIHCLDLSGVTATKTVSWLPLTKYGIENAPEETLFYSLVQGRGELIMFGGIQTDVNNMRRPMQSSNIVSNAVYFLSCKKILR